MRPSNPPQFWSWNSPLPYLFGGLGLLLVLIAAALMNLACSYQKLPSSHPEHGRRMLAQPSTVAAEVDNMTPKIVVVMAGDDKPTHLAIPIRPSSLSCAAPDCGSQV